MAAPHLAQQAETQDKQIEPQPEPIWAVVLLMAAAAVGFPAITMVAEPCKVRPMVRLVFGVEVVTPVQPAAKAVQVGEAVALS